MKQADEFRNLCRSVFAQGNGQDLLGKLEKIYCDGKLYCDSDRDTVYFIAQRDLILELIHNSKGEL